MQHHDVYRLPYLQLLAHNFHPAAVLYGCLLTEYLLHRFILLPSRCIIAVSLRIAL